MYTSAYIKVTAILVYRTSLHENILSKCVQVEIMDSKMEQQVMFNQHHANHISAPQLSFQGMDDLDLSMHEGGRTYSRTTPTRSACNGARPAHYAYSTGVRILSHYDMLILYIYMKEIDVFVLPSSLWRLHF